MKEIHIIDEGHGWYLYSTTGEREDVIFSTAADIDGDEIIAKAHTDWRALICRCLGKTWTEIEAAMDNLDLGEYPAHWAGIGESMIACEGYEFVGKRHY